MAAGGGASERAAILARVTEVGPGAAGSEAVAKPDEPAAAAGQAQQLVLSPFAAGDMVRFYSERGWRTGRFVQVAARGRRRGLAEVAIGGRLLAEERVWVAPDRLILVAARGAAASASARPARARSGGGRGG